MGKKQVMLIGDSIRDGYRGYVREILKDEAEVVWSEDNARFVSYTLFCVRAWIEAFGPHADVVCWNNGLWDVVHMMDAEYPIVSPEEYRRTLKCIIGQIRQALPAAKIIWARITPIIEAENRRTRPDHPRYNRDIIRFNGIADEVMAENGIRTVDLYSLMEAAGETVYVDGVHYTQEGARMQAEAMCAAIRGELNG